MNERSLTTSSNDALVGLPTSSESWQPYQGTRAAEAAVEMPTSSESWQPYQGTRAAEAAVEMPTFSESWQPYQGTRAAEAAVEMPTFSESWHLYRRRVAEEVAPYILTAPAMLGDPAIWARIAAGERTLGLLASARAPAGVLLAIHDLAKAWRRHGPIIVSGFHAPAENEALAVLLHGPQPAVLVLARALYRRPPQALRPALDAGRLLIISPFQEGVRRAAMLTAAARNRLVASLADELLIAYAEPGGKTAALASEALAWGKPVYALDHPANANLSKQGMGVYTLPGPGSS